MIRRFTITLAAVCTVISGGLAITAAHAAPHAALPHNVTRDPAPPGSSWTHLDITVPPPPGRACTAGVIDYGYNNNAPSWVQQDWESNGCSQEISPKEEDVFNVFSYGGWVESVEFNTRASSPEAAQFLWERYRNDGTSDPFCQEVFPFVQGQWTDC